MCFSYILNNYSDILIILFQLEIRLAEKEEGLLEKDLIFEQDCRLCERVRARVEAGKDDTLILAKKVSYPLVSFPFT